MDPIYLVRKISQNLILFYQQYKGTLRHKIHYIKVKLSAKVKLFVSLLCVCAILPAKFIPEMTYTVSGGTLNPTHSLTHSGQHSYVAFCCVFHAVYVINPSRQCFHGVTPLNR